MTAILQFLRNLTWIFKKKKSAVISKRWCPVKLNLMTTQQTYSVRTNLQLTSIMVNGPERK